VQEYGSSGTYWQVLTAVGGSGNGVVTFTVEPFAGCVIALNGQVNVTFAPPNSHTAGGTGGCRFIDGNIKVRAIQEEPAFAGIANAHILVGQSAVAGLYEHNPEALLGGASTPADNFCEDAPGGLCELYDYSGTLCDQDPGTGTVTNVTAGPPPGLAQNADRSYFTIVDTNASDLILPLRLLYPPTSPVSWINEDASEDFFCIWSMSNPLIHAGLALPILDLNFFSGFRLSSLMGRDHCVDLAGTPTAVPENFYFPDHSFACAFGGLDEVFWNLRLDAARYNPERVGMPFGEVYLDSYNNGGFVGMLTDFVYTDLGFLRNATVNDDGNFTVPLNDDYTENLQITVNVNVPQEADIIGISSGDYDGTLGMGEMFFMGHQIEPWAQVSTPGEVLNVPVSDLATGPPAATVVYQASFAAMYFDPDDATRGLFPLARERTWARTSVLLRESGGGPPYGSSGGTWTVTSMLGLALPSFSEPGHFEWTDAAQLNSTTPHYSMSELNLVTRTWYPAACGGGAERKKLDSVSTQWIVVRPYSTSCGGNECFDLPTLPNTWARAAAGQHNRSGFERRVGAADPCPCDGDESCIDVDDGGPNGAVCAVNAAPNYLTRDYQQRLHVFRLGLIGTFNWDDFGFEENLPNRTHEASNYWGFSNPSVPYE
jgi:hypothetical protein